MINAIKNNATKKFSQVAWDLLGENKNGWVEQTGEVLEQKAIQVPETGQKVITTVQVVENIIVPVVEQTAQVVEETKIVTTSENEFNALAKEFLTKGNIKDYFDTQEISYKATDSLADLIAVLNDNLAGDVEVLKSKFSI